LFFEQILSAFVPNTVLSTGDVKTVTVPALKDLRLTARGLSDMSKLDLTCGMLRKKSGEIVVVRAMVDKTSIETCGHFIL
jgi:hypothetical protein